MYLIIFRTGAPVEYKRTFGLTESHGAVSDQYKDQGFFGESDFEEMFNGPRASPKTIPLEKEAAGTSSSIEQTHQGRAIPVHITDRVCPKFGTATKRPFQRDDDEFECPNDATGPAASKFKSSP